MKKTILIAAEPLPYQHVKEVQGNGRDEDEQLPVYVCVHYINIYGNRHQSLNGEADACFYVEFTIDGAILGCFLSAGIRHHLDELGRYHFGIGVSNSHQEGSAQWCHAMQDRKQQQEVDDE